MIDSADLHVTTPPVSRRALAAGVAWSAPVVAIGAAAPAAAASGTGTVTNRGVVTRGGGCGVVVNGTASTGANPGLTFYDATTVESPITVTFFFDAVGLSFSTSSAGWTNLLATGETFFNGSRRYVGYRSTYTRSVTPNGATTTLPYQFTSNSGCTTAPTFYFARSSSVVDGVTLTTAVGPITTAGGRFG